MSEDDSMYLVAWPVIINATSHREAAERAWAIFRDSSPTQRNLTVQDYLGDGGTVNVDMGPEDE